MEMIDNSLTVKIEEDMLNRANISPPKEVRRLGTEAAFDPSQRKARPMTSSMSAGKLPRKN